MTARRLVLLLLACAVGSAATEGSTRYDPRLRFRTLSTPRFHIHYHQGEETQARRLAVIAERVAARLDVTLGPPSGRVHVVLVDQSDLSNGWATPVPFNLIEITAATPDPASFLGNTDDWLELVFTHEYTHVVHLSRSAGWIGGLRRGFGRMPLLFPNLYLPLWQIEGIATWHESAVTGSGRVRAGDFRALLQQAAAEQALEPLDRVGGGLVDWPSGTAPYLYGAYFHEYLATRFGEPSLQRLTDETARRIPYLGAPAFKRVFGQHIGDLWKDFETDAQRSARQSAGGADRLTHHGFIVAGPRFAPDGRLFYSVVNPHEFPAMYALDAPSRRNVEITSRYLGNGLGFTDSAVVFDQAEIVNQVGLQSDLYAVDTGGGRRWRITRNVRAADPDVSPDGVTVVCTVQRPDRRDLAILRLPARGRLGTPEVLLSEPDTHFALPRWSPDGRWIAVERTRRGAAGEIVLVDPVQRRVVRTLSPRGVGRSTAPAWMTDDRVLFTVAFEDHGFQVVSADVEAREFLRLADTGVNTRSPAVSRDGRTIVFVGQTVEGYDLFSMPLDRARWDPVAVASAEPPRPAVDESAVRPAPDDAAYAPLKWLAPRFWIPTIESDAGELVVGAATAAGDALGRHLYGVELGWSSARGRPDWQVAYAYDRWWPTLFANVADDTDRWRAGEARKTEATVGMVLPFRRVRWSQSVLAAMHASTETVACAACAPAVDERLDRRAFRAGWAVNAARGYGYSVSLEEGWHATITHELTRRAFGSDADGGSAVVDLRGYVPVWPRHGVLAGRAAAATSWGEESARRRFTAAGNGPQAGGFQFDFDAIGLLRGAEEDDISGAHAAVINVEYRFPLLRIDRGIGTWPLFVRAWHGAVFTDVGHAWTTRFTAEDVQVSLGAELSLDTVVGFVLPLTFTAGAALVDPPGRPRGIAVFGRIGRAF